MHKVKFKHPTYLPNYAEVLMNMVDEKQIKAIDKVQDYNGENSKITGILSRVIIKITQWRMIACATMYCSTPT
jgi:hypothetical protein